MSHKERIIELINKNVPEVKDVYQGTLTLIERLEMWDVIERVNWMNISDESSEEIIHKCYQNFISELDRHISEERQPVMQVNMANLKSKLLNQSFVRNPREFIREMTEMIGKENDLIKKYYFDEKPIDHDLKQSNTDFDVMEILNNLAQELKCQLQAICEAEAMLNHEEIVPVCEGLFESLFRKMEESLVYLKKAKQMFQKKMLFNAIGLPPPDNVMTLESLDENFHILTRVLCSVRAEMKRYEEMMCKLNQSDAPGAGFSHYFNLNEYKIRLGEFLHRYLRMSVVTVKAPATQYNISSSVGAKKKEPESDNPTQKTSEKRKEKKEIKSGMSSTLKILGAEPFMSDLRLDHESCTVCLVNERTLPESAPEGTDLQLNSGHVTLCAKLLPEKNYTSLGPRAEVTFGITEVTKITRSSREASFNSETSSLVCANFARFCYKIAIRVYGVSETLHAVSHPIGLRTGSVQLLPFHGSLTWYYWNVDNVYETFRNPQRLPVTAVLDMLDKQVSNIQDSPGSSNTSSKSRSLSVNEREFLSQLLLKGDLSAQTVSLPNFIGAKTEEHKRKSSATSVDKNVPDDFQFHTWFYALLNSLKTFMRGLWLDGLIYEICSQNETTKVLRSQDTPIGTVMLRPSLSKLHSSRSMQPYLDIVLELKTDRGGTDVSSINWERDNIKYLPDTLQNQGNGFKCIQGVNNRRSPITILRKYFQNDDCFNYRQTKFKLTMSMKIISISDEDLSEMPPMEKKKAEDNMLQRMDSDSSGANSHCIHDNQSIQTWYNEDRGVPLNGDGAELKMEEPSQEVIGLSTCINPLWNEEMAALITGGNTGLHSSMFPSINMQDISILDYLVEPIGNDDLHNFNNNQETGHVTYHVPHC